MLMDFAFFCMCPQATKMVKQAGKLRRQRSFFTCCSCAVIHSVGLLWSMSPIIWNVCILCWMKIHRYSCIHIWTHTKQVVFLEESTRKTIFSTCVGPRGPTSNIVVNNVMMMLHDAKGVKKYVVLLQRAKPQQNWTDRHRNLIEIVHMSDFHDVSCEYCEYVHMCMYGNVSMHVYEYTPIHFYFDFPVHILSSKKSYEEARKNMVEKRYLFLVCVE